MDVSPSCSRCSSPLFFLLCKINRQTQLTGDAGGHSGVAAGPALLSLVGVSAGCCSLLSPASQTGFLRPGLALPKAPKPSPGQFYFFFFFGHKGAAPSTVGHQRGRGPAEMVWRAGERHTDRMALLHFDLWSRGCWVCVWSGLVLTLPPPPPPFLCVSVSAPLLEVHDVSFIPLPQGSKRTEGSGAVVAAPPVH